MVVETVPLARVPLARSIPRLLLTPAVAILVALAGMATGVWLGGWQGIALVAAGIVVVVLAVLLLLRLLTLSLEVDVGALRLRSLAGSREYVLARGPVTRVRVRGEDAVPLRAWLGFLGWSLGGARLRGDERIRLVRLAPTDTLILVPIAEGRLGIAAASESELVAALSAAARVQQRLDAVASRERRFVLRQPSAAQSSAGIAPAPASARLRPPSLLDEPPRIMTGIERVELEERLAAQRAAALAAAEAERVAAERAAAEAAATAPAADAARPAAEGRPRRRPRLAAPSLRRPAWVTSTAAGLALIVALPLIGAGGVALAAAFTGQLRDDGARLTVLALALAGPAGSAGAMIARRWWPRLAPLVTSSALLALVLIGRSLIS